MGGHAIVNSGRLMKRARLCKVLFSGITCGVRCKYGANTFRWDVLDAHGVPGHNTTCAVSGLL